MYYRMVLQNAVLWRSICKFAISILLKFLMNMSMSLSNEHMADATSSTPPMSTIESYGLADGLLCSHDPYQASPVVGIARTGQVRK